MQFKAFVPRIQSNLTFQFCIFNKQINYFLSFTSPIVYQPTPFLTLEIHDCVQ